MSVTTMEQARALPEVPSGMWDEERILGPDGDITVRRTPRPFVPRPTKGNEILLFTDRDGRCMQVVYTKDGPAKCEWRY